MGRLYVDIKPNERVLIGENITVELTDISMGRGIPRRLPRRTRLVITAPNEVKVSRELIIPVPTVLEEEK